MTTTEVNSAAREIATVVNILLSDEVNIDFAVEYRAIVDNYMADYSFESGDAKGLFSSIVNSEFSKLDNYRKVFPVVKYK